ncbi:MAG: HipA domain-containing protein [Aquabacterium sp.]|uniref:HipA domain-containing protein n=1 Tax=Aquabacterium sp. TaxID=1872578 RepID=UPI0025C58614|nr:HipA domain-containing protein [Aquabacterium sp.]MBI5926279.1 HipA domain-containing protein [Aquabacterium sp.]
MNGPGHTLTVWIGDQVAGNLHHHPTTNRFAFAYADAWREARDAFALGPQLPLKAPDDQSPDQHSAIVRQFFENLLPEGNALDHAAQAHGVSKSNLLGLIHALGRETAGAIRLTAGDVVTPTEEPEQLREITREELSQRIRQRAQLPFSVWDQQVRLSIAGYQDKIAVYEHDGRLFLVNGGPKASTVILKPVPTRPALASLPGNELMCMQLARAAGLPVAEAWLEHVPEPVLFVKRFDRRETPTGVERQHLIDGCQLLGLSVGLKYERPYGDGPDVRNIRDGASLRALFQAINQHSLQPAVDRLALLRWAIFQVLIGNTDAHGKNLSFFVQPSGVRLAPAYDMVCIPALKDAQLSGTLAMAVGDAFTEAEITPFDWAQLGQQAGLRPSAMAQQMKGLIGKVTEALKLTGEIAQRHRVGQDTIDAISQHVIEACDRHRTAATQVKAIKPDWL